MGLLDRIGSGISNAVSNVEQKVESAASTVSSAVSSAEQKVEQKAEQVFGHPDQSSFDTKPRPSAPGAHASATPTTGSASAPTIKASQLQNNIVGDGLSNAWHWLKDKFSHSDPPPAAPPPATTSAKPADTTPAPPPPPQASTDPKAAPTGAEYDVDQKNGVYQPLKPKVADSTPLGNDGAAILQNYSQANGPDAKDTNMERCGPTSVIGAALAKGGPKEVASLARNIVDKTPSMKPAEKKQFLDLANKLDSGKGTYGDLGKLSNLIQNRYAVQTNTGGAVSNMGMNDLYGKAGMAPPQSNASGLSDEQLRKPENFDKAFPPGKPGSWPAKISIGGANQGNHWVTIGRDKDGRAFVFDPFPKKGQSQLIYQDKDPAAFGQYQAAINSSKDGTGYSALHS